MSFIDMEHAKKLSEWDKKHPKESEGYYREHSELSQLFITHKIKWTEFEQKSNELKLKYHFLEE